MKRCGVVATVLLLALLALSAAATGHRAPTSSELAGLTAFSGEPATCFRGEISTVDSAWGVVSHTNRGSCPPADGVVVLRLDRARATWSVVTEGSDFGRHSCAWLAQHIHVPAPVALDLGLCQPLDPVPRLDCAGADGMPVPSRKPAVCAIVPAGAPLAGSADLQRLRWSAWGASTATATGGTRSFHEYGPYTPIRVQAYRPEPSSCGLDYRVYTRVRVTSRFGSGVYKPPTC